MAEVKETPQSLEDLVYETRFLLNVLVDVLVEKKILSEDELYDRYDKVLDDAEKELGKP